MSQGNKNTRQHISVVRLLFIYIRSITSGFISDITLQELFIFLAHHFETTLSNKNLPRKRSSRRLSQLNKPHQTSVFFDEAVYCIIYSYNYELYNRVQGTKNPVQCNRR